MLSADKKSQLSKKENHLNDVIPISRTIMTFRKLHAGVQFLRFLRLNELLAWEVLLRFHIEITEVSSHQALFCIDFRGR